jgi:Phage tail tube protein
MVDATSSLLFKKETVSQTDAAPTAAANAMLTLGLNFRPLQSDQLEHNYDKPVRGANPVGLTNRRMAADFKLELTGSGAAGTAAAWQEALECCGMEAPVLTASVKAEQKYAALGATLSSATMHDYRGSNQRRRMVGARGDITEIDFTAGAFPTVGMSFLGILGATPYDQTALTSPDLTTRWKKAVEVNSANTSFTLDGYAAILRSFKVNANTQLTLRNLVGSRYIRIGNHELKGKIVIEAPDFTAKNYFANLQAETLATSVITHGVGLGNIVKMTAPNLQIVDIQDGEENGVAMYELDVILTVNAGQDDLLISAE